MNKRIVGLLIVVVISIAAAGYFFQSRRIQETSVQPVAVPAPQPSAADNEPLTRFPVPPSPRGAGESIEPLPTLQESDPVLLNALGRQFDLNRLGELIVVKDMINRFVVTVDNLPRAKLPLRLLTTLPLPGNFMVNEKGDGMAEMNPDNYNRYTKYVNFFDAMDSQKVAAVYFHFYPLIQQAYRELGYKTAYFNDRLIAAIDNLLATPAVIDPVSLVQPSVFYRYADPRLENLSSGQKILIRIGSDNATKIKAKLRELRVVLTKRDIDR